VQQQMHKMESPAGRFSVSASCNFMWQMQTVHMSCCHGQDGAAQSFLLGKLQMHCTSTGCKCPPVPARSQGKDCLANLRNMCFQSLGSRYIQMCEVFFIPVHLDLLWQHNAHIAYHIWCHNILNTTAVNSCWLPRAPV